MRTKCQLITAIVAAVLIALPQLAGRQGKNPKRKKESNSAT